SCFFQAEDGIRDFHVTGVQTCALPISASRTVTSLMAMVPLSECRMPTLISSEDSAAVPVPDSPDDPQAARARTRTAETSARGVRTSSSFLPTCYWKKGDSAACHA